MSEQTLYRIVVAILWVPAGALLAAVGWGLNWVYDNHGIGWMAACIAFIFVITLPIAIWFDIKDGQYTLKELPWAAFRPRRHKNRY